MILLILASATAVAAGNESLTAYDYCKKRGYNQENIGPCITKRLQAESQPAQKKSVSSQKTKSEKIKKPLKEKPVKVKKEKPVKVKKEKAPKKSKKVDVAPDSTPEKK